MASPDETAPATVIWVDLATPDLDAARRFYGELFGWSFESMPAVAAGARTLFGPLEAADQGRVATFADPTGALFGVRQGRAHRGAEVIGEPGAMAWHELYTRDLAAAPSGAAFGVIHPARRQGTR